MTLLVGLYRACFFWPGLSRANLFSSRASLGPLNLCFEPTRAKNFTIRAWFKPLKFDSSEVMVRNFWLIGRNTLKKFETKLLGLDLLISWLVNYFRNPDLYSNCKHFGDGLSLLEISSQNILPRAFSSYQKAWLDRAELFKTRGSRAKFRAEPRLDTPLNTTIIVLKAA